MTYRILSIETSTECGSIALSQGDGVLSHSLGMIPQAHSRSILPSIEALLSEAGVSLQALDAIAVTKGPGSFTGVRLGLSVAQGLSFGLSVPCIPISTLAVLAYGARDEVKSQGVTRIMAAMDARMEEVYVGIYELVDSQLTCLLPDTVKKPTEIDASLLGPHFENDKRVIAIGTGWQVAYQEAILQSSLVNSVIILPESTPQAADLARLAIIAMQKGEHTTPEECRPAYCRDKVVF